MVIKRQQDRMRVKCSTRPGTSETVFRIIVSVNLLSLYGAVAEMCEEYESFHDRTVKHVVGGQSSSSFVPSVIKTNVPLDNDDRAHKDLLLQRYGERIEKLSQQDRLSKFCTDAGFLTVVENGQYFMTKDTAEFSQFTDAVACREYTLPRDEETSEAKGWIRGNTKIEPVLKVTTCCLHGKYGVEIRVKSVNKDNSHSWVRISHGLNKFVTNLNNNKQETLEVQFEEYASRLNAGDLASWSKAKAKPQRRESSSSSTRTIPIGERTWTDVEPGEYSISDYDVSKKLIHLLRHGSLPRDNDGAIEFWRIKDNLQKHFLYCHHWSDEKWKKSMARGGGNKKRCQYCTDSSLAILYVRALQGHSGRSPIDPTFRTMSLFPTVSSSPFIMSDVQSIYIPSSIQVWYQEVKIWATDRQYSFCLWIPWTKTIRIMTRSNWKHRVLHKTCIKHGRNIRIRCIGLTSILLWRKDWRSIKHDRTPSLFTKHSQLIVFWNLFGWKLEKSYTKRYTCHLDLLQRSPRNTTGRKNMVQKLLDDQMEKLCNNLKVPNQANQMQIQIMIERWNPLFAVTQVTRKVPPKHVSLMTARTSMLKMKQIMIEWWNPLFAVMQIANNQC